MLFEHAKVTADKCAEIEAQRARAHEAIDKAIMFNVIAMEDTEEEHLGNKTVSVCLLNGGQGQISHMAKIGIQSSVQAYKSACDNVVNALKNDPRFSVVVANPLQAISVLEFAQKIAEGQDNLIDEINEAIQIISSAAHGGMKTTVEYLKAHPVTSSDSMDAIKGLEKFVQRLEMMSTLAKLL